MSVILVIDDNPTTRKVVRLTLGNEGFEVVEASGGVEALAAVATKQPDLVLQDLLLPDMDGFELIGRLRALPAMEGVPVVAFSGFLSRLEYGRAAAVGFTDFLAKPVEPSRLLQVIRSHLPETVAGQPIGSKATPGKRVLLVDDDPIQLKLCSLRLRTLGFTVETATDGVEALQIVRRGSFDAVLSDVLMPRMDGFLLCSEIRRDRALAKLPVILTSSNYVEQGDRVLAKRMGASAFVVRSPDMSDVIAALDSAIAAPLDASAPQLLATPAEHHDRVIRQLERQAAMNTVFALRFSMQASMLSVVAGVSEALTLHGTIKSSQPDILASLLDASGISHGALFLCTGEGQLELGATLGFSQPASTALRTFCGHRDLFEGVIASKVPRAVATSDEDEAARELLAGIDVGCALMIPFVSEGDCLGMLLLGSRERDLTEHDWLSFARMIAVQIGQALALSRDVRARRESEARFARLWESGIVGIAIADLSGNIYDANDEYLRMLGWSRAELIAGQIQWASQTPAKWRSVDAIAIAELQATGAARPWEKELTRKDGTNVPVLIGVAMLDQSKCIAYVSDLSERERAQALLHQSDEQLRQAQKMEAVGRLAGGIAHDFNNALSVVLSYGEMMLEDLRPGEPMREDIEEICKAAQRAARLTRQLLTFSRQQVVAPRVLDLNEVVFSTDKMLQRILGADIELVSLRTDPLGHVSADLGSIEQVIMNLVINARDAMPTGGTLTLETANVVLDEGYVRTHHGASVGPYVMLSVSDNGIGMDRATQARIFEPFFTTKEQGKGTGLGLSTVFGIVQQTGGSIWVYSELGLGTTFKIYLPRVDADADAAVSSAVAPKSLRGSETILLVEDEDQVRVVARDILRRNGYQVIEARNAGEAMLLTESSPVLDLLLTDVVMPQMSGPVLAKRLAASRPGMKILCMSGYTDDSIVRHGVLDTTIAYLQKPFTLDTLTRKVRQVLDAA